MKDVARLAAGADVPPAPELLHTELVGRGSPVVTEQRVVAELAGVVDAVDVEPPVAAEPQAASTAAMAATVSA